jgi:Zn-dependent dipeptidase, microsomal dipeptidase homolog
MNEADKSVPVFDGHNDVLLRIMREKAENPVSSFFKDWPGGHLDFPRIKQSGFIGGFFALFIPEQTDDHDVYKSWVEQPEYRLPLPDELPLNYARKVALHQTALLLRMDRDYPDQFALCRNLRDLSAAREQGKIAAIFHMEGADAIDPDFYFLDVLHAAGLRSLGLVWSRKTPFGEGVPFAFPSSPDTGPGLTDLGKSLVQRCNALNIMIDLSHLNEKGFWDVAEISDAPLVATHSNAHSICPSSRNLTDSQLDAIRQSKGMVGINYATSFLRPDGKENTDTSLETMIRHFDYMIDHLGIDHVGLGSDFDGATIPSAIQDVTGNRKLLQAMARHGYDDEMLNKIAWKNWISFLERFWKN